MTPSATIGAASRNGWRSRGVAVCLALALLAGCSASGDGSAGSPTDPSGPGSTDAPTTSGPTGSAPSPTTEPTDAPDPLVDDVADEVFGGMGDPRIDVGHYEIEVRADPGTAAISGNATLTLAATTADPLQSFTLDLNGPKVTSITVNGEPATSKAAEAGEIEITPKVALEPGEMVGVAIDYAGEPSPTSFPDLGVPVGWQADDGGGWFTMSEPDGTSTWVPVSEHPSDKATWTVTLDTPAEAVGVSNGRLTSRASQGDRRTWVWETDQPMASYLVFAGVGAYDLMERDGPGGSKAVFAFTPGLPAEGRKAFDEIDPIMDFFAEEFGGYPDDDTGAIVVNTNLRLALETQTRPLFGIDGVNGPSVLALAHELGHQWFGDAVSAATWADVWLNESFATYADWLYRDHAGGPDIHDLADQAAGASPLAVLDPKAAATFDPAIYNGGARALYALRLTIGDDQFSELLRTWYREQDGGSATTDEFIALAEKVSSRDLSTFVEDWLRSPDQPDLPG